MRIFYDKRGNKPTAVVLNSFVPFNREIGDSKKAKSVRVRTQKCNTDCILGFHNNRLVIEKTTFSSSY